MNLYEMEYRVLLSSPSTWNAAVNRVKNNSKTAKRFFGKGTPTKIDVWGYKNLYHIPQRVIHNLVELLVELGVEDPITYLNVVVVWDPLFITKWLREESYSDKDRLSIGCPYWEILPEDSLLRQLPVI